MPVIKTLIRSFAILILLLNIGKLSYSQDFSNKGKDFWVAYGNHASMFNADGSPNTAGGSQDMVLYFTSDRNATVTVSIPATGWSRNYTVTANQVTTSDIIPKSGADDARILTEGTSNKGIHVTANEAIIAYAHIYDGAISGASLLFPTTILTNEYYSINFKQTSNDQNSYSYCYVVAVEDNTTIEVIPAANTISHLAGDVVTVTLNKGEVFNLFGKTLAPVQVGTNNFGQPIYLYRGEDLTGTRIRSIAGNNATCKKIAVFSGSGKINIQCAANVSGTSDNYMQQAFPPNAWGQKYLTAPTVKMPTNFFRICVNDPATVVKRNGLVLNGLINNFYYEYQSSTPDYIEASKPVMVSQYLTTRAQCGNPNISYTFNNQIESLGDPEMIYLSPMEQTISKVTINSTPNAAIREHYINIVIKNAGSASLKIDGSPPIVSGNNHLAIPGYLFFQVPLTQGSHTIQSDSGFNAIAYGYGNAESYGYNAGTNVKDLYQYITIRNQYASVNNPDACMGSPFFISLTLPYLPVSMKWKIPNYPDYNPPGTITADSSFTLNGKTLYVFHLPNAVTYNNAGTYPIEITVNNPTASGCTGEQTVSYDLQVFNPPMGDFSWISKGCTDSVITFTTNNNPNGKTIIKHFWDFGDGTYSYINNPAKIYATPGTFKVRYTVLTDIGCLSDTTEKIITITKTPAAKFGISSPQCQNKTILLIDSSSLEGGFGTITNWNWSPGIGNPVNKVTNESLQVTYPDTVSYTAGLQVISHTGCTSPLFILPVKVHPNPVADFRFTDACLPNATINFTTLSTIPNGFQSSLTHDWNFGDAISGALNFSSLLNPSHLFVATGPYPVKLKVTSVPGCTDSTVKINSNIYPQPTVDFAAPSEACMNTPVSFADASNGMIHPISQWEWRIYNSSGLLTITSTQKDATIIFSTPGIYSIQHWVVTDHQCTSDTLTKTILVNPLPAAGFKLSAPLCEKNQITLTDTSTISSGSIVRRHWNLGDGTLINVNNNSAFEHSYILWGNKTIKLLAESDKGCVNDTLYQTIKINPLPKAGYILQEVCLQDAQALFLDKSKIEDNSEAFFTYQWRFNTGAPSVNPPPVPANSTSKNPVIQFFKEADYLLSLLVTSTDGCIDSVTSIPFTVNGSNPKADFKVINQSSLCSKSEVLLKDQSTVDFGSLTRIEIYWDNINNPVQFETDDFPSPAKIYNHLYSQFQPQFSKTYQIKYKAYSGITCVSEITRDITIYATPVTQFLPVPGICPDDQPRQLTGASELSGIPGTGIFSGAGISVSGLFNPAVAGVGVHTIRYTFTTVNGCSAFSEQTIEVWPRPVAKFTTLLPACEKNVIQFSDSSLANANNISSWIWDFGDGAIDTITAKTVITHYYNSYGVVTPKLRIINNKGCSSLLYSAPLPVHPIPKVNFQLPKICLPEGKAVFHDLSTIPDNSENQFQYNWSFGDRNVFPPGSDRSFLKDPVYYYKSQGPFTVQLKITSGSGCVDSLSRQLVDVYPQPKARFVSKDSICIGNLIDFTDQSDGIISPITKWNWNFGNGALSNLQNPGYVYPSPGIYQIQLFTYSSEGCVSDTAEKLIHVWAYPKVNAGPDFRMLDYESKLISGVFATGSGLQYWWTPPTYLNDQTVKTPVIHQPKDDIVYQLEVTGRGGCKSTDEVFVKVLKLPKPPNTFTPNGDGINDTWEIKYLNDFPGCIVEVYNTTGTLVYRSVGYSTPWNGKWNGNDLPAGTYYYVLDPKNGAKKQAGYITIFR